MTIRLSRAALADLERLQSFLADRNANAAQRAIFEIIRGIDSLTSFPGRGTPAGHAGLRDLWVPFGRSAYLIRFSHNAVTGETTIARIWHAREARP
ncbi:type II toxin-antitoxin system RelE/ParE family toxin [Tardiphaga sp.]|jgi:plasmid stabilization system protein ParE|uniref:type II toxin-antitoxin system RelE/ParE family toxin n=1 Tax=Tardiphaga sp. TaxID=1926292 RepID=UPI0037D9A105